jgi:hypothetical protein
MLYQFYAIFGPVIICIIINSIAICTHPDDHWLSGLQISCTSFVQLKGLKWSCARRFDGVDRDDQSATRPNFERSFIQDWCARIKVDAKEPEKFSISFSQLIFVHLF